MVERILKLLASILFLLGMIPMGFISIIVYIYNGKGYETMEWYDQYWPFY